MKTVHYTLVDVFTDRQFAGNQLAVVPDGHGLSSETMQAITREFNLSETTFVLPPESPANTCRVRIFTPGSEMPMAGHPTVGTAFVLARNGTILRTEGEQRTRAVFEEGVGPIPVSVEFENDAPGIIRMTQPLPTWGASFDDRRAAAAALSLTPDDIDDRLPVQIVSCGVPFLYVPLRTLDAAHRARLNRDAWDRSFGDTNASGLFLFARDVEYAGSTVHSRMFAPDLGVTEDPATGAASGPLGAYLVRYGVVERGSTAHIVSEQGVEMGRPSFVHIEIDSRGEEITGVRISGRCRYVGEGRLELDL